MHAVGQLECVTILACDEMARFAMRGSECPLLSKTEKSIANILCFVGGQLAASISCLLLRFDGTLVIIGSGIVL